MSEPAWKQLADYAAERGYTSGEVRALLRPAGYLAHSRVLRSRGIRLDDVRLDAGAWAAAVALARQFSIDPIFDRLPNARPAATEPPPPVNAPATAGVPLGAVADWRLATSGATVTFATRAGERIYPSVIFDLPQWTDPAPRADPLGDHRATISAAASLGELVAAVEAAVAASAAYLSADDAPGLGRNQRWGLQDLRRHGFFTAAAQAAPTARLPATDRPRVSAALVAAKEKLLCDRDYEMDTGARKGYWPYWKNYATPLEKALAQTAAGTDDYWQIKNRLEEVWTRKTVKGTRREIDEKDMERSTGMAVVQQRPYSDDGGHRVSLAPGSHPIAPRYEVVHLEDGTKVFREGDQLLVDGPGRREVAPERARNLKRRAVEPGELRLRPLLAGEMVRAGIPHDWSRDGSIDLAPIDISWWGHCHDQAPLCNLGIDPTCAVDYYRADPRVPAEQRLQRYTADDVWDAAGALTSDHEAGYAARGPFRMRDTQVEVTKFVGSRNDGGHWITLEFARPDARRVRIDAEVTEIWHKSDPQVKYPDPAARFRRDLPDDAGGFAANPDWLAAAVGDEDEIAVDGLGRRVTLRTTFVTFDATGQRSQVKQVIEFDPTTDVYVKLADEIGGLEEGGGGTVTEHWYNAKLGTYYPVRTKVAAGGSRKELSRGQPVTVRAVELRQETVYDSVIDLHDFITKNMGMPFTFDVLSGFMVWNYPVDKVRIDRPKEIERTEGDGLFTYTSYRLRFRTMGGPTGDARYIIKRDAAGNAVRAIAEDPMPDFAFRNEHWVCAPATADLEGRECYNVSALQGGYLLDKAGEKVVSGLWRRLATLLYASLSAPAGTSVVRVFEAADGTLSTYADETSWKKAISA